MQQLNSFKQKKLDKETETSKGLKEQEKYLLGVIQGYKQDAKIYEINIENLNEDMEK